MDRLAGAPRIRAAVRHLIDGALWSDAIEADLCALLSPREHMYGARVQCVAWHCDLGGARIRLGAGSAARRPREEPTQDTGRLVPRAPESCLARLAAELDVRLEHCGVVLELRVMPQPFEHHDVGIGH